MSDTRESLLTDDDLAELEKQSKSETDLFEGVRVPLASAGTKINVKTFATASDIALATAINPNDIDGSLVSLASEFSRFNLLAAQGRLQMNGLETRLELVSAKLDKLLRDQATKAGEKITEAKLEQAIRRNKHYLQTSTDLNEAKAVVKVLEGTLEAIKMKRDMLVQMNKNNRDEWDVSTSNTGSAMSVDAMKARFNSSVRKPQNK
jgi:hypothetical protein